MNLFQHYRKLFLIVSLLLGFSYGGYAQVNSVENNNLLRWDYSASEVTRNVDTQEFNIVFTVSPKDKVAPQELFYIYPSYVSKDGKNSIELAPICLAGDTRYKVIKRRKALHNIDRTDPAEGGDNNVQPYKDFGNAPVTITHTVPFERWMATGRLVVEERSYGCAECDIHQQYAEVASAAIPLFGEAYYAFDFITPEKVEMKTYEEEFDCKVTFEVGNHVLKKNFNNNQQELAALEQFMSKAFKLKGATLRELELRGYASPEGSFASNKTLAVRRTQALSNYVEAKYPALKKVSSRKTEGIGEDWQGLKEAVENSTLAHKDDIVAIINQYATDTEREAAIKKLDNGQTYATLLKEYYPPLRKTVFSLRFDVRPYMAEEIPEIYETNPKLLSHYEMYQLAQQYEKRGENPVDIYRTIVTHFPSDVTAALNLANALLKYNKDADAALQVLESVKDDSRVLFPMAVAYDMKGLNEGNKKEEPAI